MFFLTCSQIRGNQFLPMLSFLLPPASFVYPSIETTAQFDQAEKIFELASGSRHITFVIDETHFLVGGMSAARMVEI